MLALKCQQSIGDNEINDEQYQDSFISNILNNLKNSFEEYKDNPL